MYIRTKDGVYEVDENSKGTEDFLWVKTNKANIVQCVWLNCIINEADTIEELCDGFYIDFVNYKGFDKDKIGEPYTFEEFRDCFMAYREYEGNSYTHCEGYGFIKTDKGLIYVAKMNESGCLELI